MANKHQHARRTLIGGLCAALLLLTLTFAVSGTFYGQRAQEEEGVPLAQAATTGVDSTPRTAAAPRTFVVSNSPSAVELGRDIDRMIDESEFRDARWGLFVMSLRDGRVLYERGGDRTLAPASNLKLYTTSVALDLLGADYRWRTSVYASAAPDRDGTIAGDLVLYGRGAPDLTSRSEHGRPPSSLDRLAEELYRQGVRRVRGDVIGDESYLQGEPLGDGWLWNDVQWYFGSEISALSINDNEVTVSVTPAPRPDAAAEISLRPETTLFHIENDAKTVERGEPATVGITRGLSDNNLRVWGDFPVGGRTITARLSVHQPALWAALLYREALERRGIKVEGSARVVDARENRTDAQAKHERAVELAFVTSRTLGEIVRLTNKESINLYAELLLRTLGKERGAAAPPADALKTRTRGDDEAGSAVVLQWLERGGISVAALRLHDGSGLSRLNLVTPEATARLLGVMTRTPSAQLFRDSLPVAGRDGTLKFRLRSVGANRLTAKTGTLTYVNSLSGYATTDDDESLAFSIICNDETVAESSTRVIDAIAARLTSYRETGQ